MKKTIEYRLTLAEKQRLKEKRITLKSLQELSPDEVAAAVDAGTERTTELLAMAEFQSIPSLGINFAEELISQGYYSLEHLRGKSAVDLLDAYEKHVGAWADPCVEDSYRLLVHFIEHRDESKRWWHFTAERKAYRAKYGYPADRPTKAWYETGQYPKMEAHVENK